MLGFILSNQMVAFFIDFFLHKFEYEKKSVIEWFEWMHLDFFDL